MRIRNLQSCSETTAGDKTILRELFHTDRDYPFGGRYSLAHARVATGQKTLRHRLRTDEVYYILSGQGMLHINDESQTVAAGDAIDIPPGSVQWIENTGPDDLEFLCIVDPAWRAEDEEIVD